MSQIQRNLLLSVAHVTPACLDLGPVRPISYASLGKKNSTTLIASNINASLFVSTEKSRANKQQLHSRIINLS